jgi:hypothetical protein
MLPIGMRPLTILPALSLTCLLTVPARAKQDLQIAPQVAPIRRGDTGLELGFRIGWGVPAGNATGDSRGLLSDRFRGILPIIFDLGYRVHPRVYLGVFYQYGFGFVSDRPDSWVGSCKQPVYSRSVSMVRFGGDVRFHLMPGRRIDPWLGAGIGYEKMYFDGSIFDGVEETETHWTASGFEFLHVDVGGDYRVSRYLSIGTFLSVSIAHYSEQTNWYPLAGQRVQILN